MRMSKIQLLPILAICGAAVGLLTPEVQAQRSTGPGVGDIAPNDIFDGKATHISGPEVPVDFEEGKTYVIEFWATWCAPCRKSIPHLNTLYKDFKRKGITVIGVSNEEPSVVASFVKKRGTGMSYTVVADPKGTFAKIWSALAKKQGIPLAFIVGPTQRIAWFGHPMDPSFERVLKLCVDGKYDPFLYAKAEPLLAGAEKSVTTRDWGHAHRQLDKVIEIDSWVFSDQMLRKYKLMLIEQDQTEEADSYLTGQIRVYSDKPDVLADIAKMMVDDPDLPKRNMEIADQAVTALARAKGEKDPEVLAVVALVAYKQGDINSAVNNQFQAWMAAKPDFKPDYKYVLDKYHAEQNAAQGSGSRRGTRR